MNNTKRNIRIIATFLLVILVVCTFVGRALYTARMPQVTAVPAERGRVRFTTETQASIVYTDMIQIIADMDFIIEEVFFDIGNPIKESDPLLRIDMEHYEQLLLIYNHKESEILHHKVVHNDNVINGVILAPTFGRIVASVKEGQQTSEGDELFLIVPNETDTKIVWYMDEDEAANFQGELSAYFTYLTGTRRQQEFVSSTNIAREWDARAQLFRYSFPYETIQRNLFGVTGELLLTHETPYHDTAVPASAVFFDEFGIPAVYALSTRTGLFGPEKYVFVVNVSLHEKSPETAAVASPLIRTDTLVISDWQGELYGGAAVWAENLGVEAFDILSQH